MVVALRSAMSPHHRGQIMRADGTVLLLALACCFTTAIGQDADLMIEITLSVMCDRKTHSGDVISVNYRGTFINGTEFESSASLSMTATRLAGTKLTPCRRLRRRLRGTSHFRPWESRSHPRVSSCLTWLTSAIAHILLIHTAHRFDQGLFDMCIGEKRWAP